MLAEITTRAAAPPIPCGRLRAAKAAPCVSGPCRAARRCSRCRTRIGPRLLSLFALLIWTVGGSQLPLNAQVMALAIERALPPLSGALGGREGVYLLSGSFDGRCTLWRGTESGDSAESRRPVTFRPESLRRSDLEDDRSPTGFAKLHSFAVATVPGASSGGEGDGVLSLLLSASRDLVVAGRNSGAIHLYALSKLDTAPFATGVQSTDGGACALSWYGDAGRAFLAGSEDGVCKSWELAEPGTRRRNQPPGALVCLGVAQVGEEANRKQSRPAIAPVLTKSRLQRRWARRRARRRARCLRSHARPPAAYAVWQMAASSRWPCRSTAVCGSTPRERGR